MNAAPAGNDFANHLLNRVFAVVQPTVLLLSFAQVFR